VIAKHIPSRKGGAGFEGLARYVVNARNGIDPASWERLGAYILDENGQGEKVAWARVTNCQSDDPGWAVKEILATQVRNTRSGPDRSYHLVVSFPEGERPSREQIEDIEDRLCEAAGFAMHQRVSAVHQNTDNWHLHVAINKVHPTSFRNVTPVRDHFRLQQACAELEVKHGLTREPHTTEPEQTRERKARGRAAAFEAEHGGQSFLAWTQEHAGAAMLAARDAGKGWQAVHQVAGALDLDVKLRGAGLVIGHRSGGRLHVKASDVDRGLAFKAMVEKLGAFEPPARESAQVAEKRYERPTGSGPLYETFQRERAAALAARTAVLDRVKARHAAYAEELAAWYRQRMRHEHAQHLRGALRQEGFRHIAEEREKDRVARIEREREERRQARSATPIPSWQTWLETQAAAGNEAALAALRSRQRRAQRLGADVLTAENADKARHVVHRHMQPAIRRDGRVIYRVRDGGLVSDEAEQVRVPQCTAAAAFLALELAADRFGSRPLLVNGSDGFRGQLASLAGMEGMRVTFADPLLERQRNVALVARQRSAALARDKDKGHDLGR
jgi:hypothetical protein